MPNKEDAEAAFNKATDRRSYDKTRLSDDQLSVVEALERNAEAAKAELREMQRMRRDEDLSAERAWLHREHATKTYEDLSITKGVKPKRSVEEVERDAVYAVDRHNAAEMERIDTRRDTRIAEVVLQAKAQEQSTDRTASVLEAKTNLRNSFDHARGRDRER